MIVIEGKVRAAERIFAAATLVAFIGQEVIRGKTIAGAKGMMKSTDTIILKESPDGATEVRVISELTLGGQLAVLGAKLIEAKSKEIFAEATANLKGKLGVAPDPEPAAPEKRGRMARLKSLLSKERADSSLPSTSLGTRRSE